MSRRRWRRRPCINKIQISRISHTDAFVLTFLFHFVVHQLHIHLESVDKDISQSPFVTEQAKTKNYRYDMWVSKDKDGGMTLQYGQTNDFEFMSRLECLDCEGVTSKNDMGCITSCANMDNYVFNGTYANGTEIDAFAILGSKEYIAGKTFDQLSGQLHGRKYCIRSSKCALICFCIDLAPQLYPQLYLALPPFDIL